MESRKCEIALLISYQRDNSLHQIELKNIETLQNETSKRRQPCFVHFVIINYFKTIMCQKHANIFLKYQLLWLFKEELQIPLHTIYAFSSFECLKRMPKMLLRSKKFYFSLLVKLLAWQIKYIKVKRCISIVHSPPDLVDNWNFVNKQLENTASFMANEGNIP